MSEGGYGRPRKDVQRLRGREAGARKTCLYKYVGIVSASALQVTLQSFV
jgi:hypothetical protein